MALATRSHAPFPKMNQMMKGIIVLYFLSVGTHLIAASSDKIHDPKSRVTLQSGEALGDCTLAQLEDEEIKIRADQTISSDERIRQLTEIWKRESLTAQTASAPPKKVAPKNTAVSSKSSVEVSSFSVKRWLTSLFSKGAKPPEARPDAIVIKQSKVIISILNQRMYVFMGDNRFREFPVSTSKYGLGDEPGSYKTPLGRFRVRCKFGTGLKSGVVLKSREPTSEIVSPNAKGRDPIVTRIIWLQGLEKSNQHAFERCIYIHGTPQENDLGRPASFGCIRMASKDVIKIYDMLPENSNVSILDKIDKVGRRFFER